MFTARRTIYILIMSGTLAALLNMSACSSLIPVVPPAEILAGTPALANSLCEACDQATLAAALTQEKQNTDGQAAATAEIIRANAQATLNAANATVNAAQTQDQNNANVLAAQIAATAEIVRAQAQATLNSASVTQSVALTQDAILQTQMASQATSNAQTLLLQQNSDALAASTQTAVANLIATQTQAVVATSQWYSDQARQRAEQRQGPLAFLWTLCLPIFFVLLAGLVLWGFWRWLRIQQSNQRILAWPVAQLPPSVVEILDQPAADESTPVIETDVIDSHARITQPDDQVRRWLDEVQRKLTKMDRKAEDDNSDKRSE